MRFLVALLPLLLGSSQLFAQACQQVNLATDAQKRRLLRDYIQTCHHRFF